MIKSITVVNPKNEALELVLNKPEKSGLIVTKVEGLGPPKATINGQEMATSDGMLYSSARVGIRNVVLYLSMVERDKSSVYGELSIEQSRHLTYRYFPLKKEVTIYINTDTQIVYCKGYVESNEPDIFSQEESCQISIICTDPYLYTEGEEETIFSGTRRIFEFPFSNDIGSGEETNYWLKTELQPLTEGQIEESISQKSDPFIKSSNKKTIEFGQIWLDTKAILNYRGTVDTGILITIHAYDKAEKIRIYNVDTREQMIIDTDKIQTITGTSYGHLDDIVISTVKGRRYCRLLRNGKWTNIIGVLSKDSDWFQISSGNNGFAFAAEKGADNLSVTFSYQNAYIGV